LALAAWAGWTEWRYSARLLAGMPEMAAVAAAGFGGPAAAARQLDLVAAAAAEVAARAADSPAGLAAHLGRWGPAAAARRRYVAAVDALLPAPLGEALAAAFATEGGSLPLYDALRTLAIVEGAAPWQPGFVAGWLAAQGAGDPALARLAVHAEALSGPPPGLPAQDAELLAQARGIAAEGDPAERAFLELARDPGMRALPGWSPASVPDLASVVVRRSGRPLEQAIPGLYTAAGWAAASGGGARAAVERAAAESARVIGTAPVSPVEEAALLEVLQLRTLDAWEAELADLRVKPFTDQPGSVMISGTLGRSGSPLEALFQTVWREVGGDDRGRSHLNRIRAAAVFSPMIQFVEQGHMAEIAQLFAGLNVALQALDADAEVGRRRLMDVQARAASIATLNRAPRLVVQIIEDVLAQTAATQSGLLKPRAALAWQRDYAGACRFALAERYPFAAGPDADLGAVADFLGPQGSLRRFFAAEVAPLIDTEESPWRWKPEARLKGFSPESATFFERALAVGDALFPADGAPVTLTMTALAQDGAATVSLGGEPVPVTTSGEPARFEWPGSAPEAGLEVAFAGGAGVERQAWPGAWGLLRFFDGLRLRARDGGQRYRLDVRVAGARVFMEMTFARPANPAAARGAIRGLACPAVL
jgi:type VI protein secretion system component VasK